MTDCNPKGFKAVLPIFLTEDNDYLTTCPECGTRTDLIAQIDTDSQHHACPSCKFNFVLLFEGEL